MKITFIENPFTSLPELHSYTADGGMWDKSQEYMYELQEQVERIMKEIFPSVKFNNNMPTCFSFKDKADEAYYTVWSIDKEIEI